MSLGIFLFIADTLFFVILRRMRLRWRAALPHFLSPAVEFAVKRADGSTKTVKLTHSTWFRIGESSYG